MGWPYLSKATVWKFSTRDQRTKKPIYQVPFTIDVTWKSTAQKRRDSLGNEFVTRAIFYTEDSRVSRSDYIAMGTSTAENPTGDAHDVRDVVSFNRRSIGRDEGFEVLT